MASIAVTFTVPDAVAQEVLEIVTDQMGYVQGETQGTRKAFFDRSLKDHVKRLYVEGKLRIQEEVDRGEEEALRETNRGELETVRQDAEAVDISVG